MAENYKHLYEQMKKMVAMYQDEIVPGMREQLGKCVEVVRCKDCKHWTKDGNGYCDDESYCDNPNGLDNYAHPDDFCSYGERKDNA